MVFGMFFQGSFSIAIGLVCITGIQEQWHIVGLVIYIGVTSFLGFLRNQVRGIVEITRGDLFTDCLCGWFAPMFALTQMEYELFVPKVVDSEKDAENEMMLTKYG